MDKRLELQQELEQFLPNVYFQPPSAFRLVYPCIVFSKKTKDLKHADNAIYQSLQSYQITVIDKDPDSTTADDILTYFQYCSEGPRLVVDNLHHSNLNLYF